MNTMLKALSGLLAASFAAACNNGIKVLHITAAPPLAPIPASCEALANVNQRTNGDAVACFYDFNKQYVQNINSVYEREKTNSQIAQAHKELITALQADRACENSSGSVNCLPAVIYEACGKAVEHAQKVEPKIDSLDPKAPLDKAFSQGLSAYDAELSHCIGGMSHFYAKQGEEIQTIAKGLKDLSQGLHRVSLFLAP